MTPPGDEYEDTEGGSNQMQLGIRILELKEMDYNDYLQSPEWDATRKDALRRAEYKCQLCTPSAYRNKQPGNRKNVLNVHHITYDRLGEELPDDLIVLCRDCHGRLHQVNSSEKLKRLTGRNK